MDRQISTKSEMLRMDAANGLAVLLREICERVDISSFSKRVVVIPPRRGFALRDAIHSSQEHSSTYLGNAVEVVNNTRLYDRIIVITDEQSHDRVPAPRCKGYIINVASNEHGVGYGSWTHIDGFSESVVDYIRMLEAE